MGRSPVRDSSRRALLGLTRAGLDLVLVEILHVLSPILLVLA